MHVGEEAEETSALFANGQFLSRIGVIDAVEVERESVVSEITGD